MIYSTVKNIDHGIKQVLMYYGYFRFAPSFKQIHTFLRIPISRNSLNKSLNRLVNNGNVRKLSLTSTILNSRFLILDSCLYTLPQYSISIQKQMKKLQMTNDKINAIQLYLKLLSKLPTVQFVGLTGSASMGNCKKNDDIDLFIITKQKSLWLTRFICVLIAKLMKLYGKKVCLNLFFDESDLTIPKLKQTKYIGHELLQMIPLCNKDKIYERLLSTNIWVTKLFPNSKIKGQRSKMKIKRQKSNVVRFTLHVTRLIDNILRALQLPLIHKNKTGLIITPTQLWLFKKDFERSIPKTG